MNEDQVTESARPACDLHMHTYYSDGRPSPQELLAQAAQLGLKTVAITDHDNTRGVREAIPLASQYGLNLIPGVEFTCRWDALQAPPGKTDIDLLGYFIDLDDAAFRAFEEATLADIHSRVEACCTRIAAANYPITLEEVFAQNPRYAGTLQLIHALQAKYAQSWDQAAALVDAHWTQVRPSRFTIDHIVGAIHATGGVAVLAHPTLVPGRAGWLQEDELAGLVAMGLDGVEIYHHRLDEAARAHFMRLARQFDLLITGGSDEHGWHSGFRYLGTEPVTPALVQALAARANRQAGINV